MTAEPDDNIYLIQNIKNLVQNNVQRNISLHFLVKRGLTYYDIYYKNKEPSRKTTKGKAYNIRIAHLRIDFMQRNQGRSLPLHSIKLIPFKGDDI